MQLKLYYTFTKWKRDNKLMVDINVKKNQGLISAIRTQLDAEQIDTSKCNAKEFGLL